MDLFLTIGKYGSIKEMLETLDCVEYDFLLEKYRNTVYGPSMWNYMLAQIAWVSANVFTKTHIKIEEFQYGAIGTPDYSSINPDTTAINMMYDNYYRKYRKEGLSTIAAAQKAGISSQKYANNLKKKRIEEALIKEQESRTLKGETK